jgi:hypothetical protein
VWRSADTDHIVNSGARWPSSGSLSRNVSVLKVKCPWKTGGRESGHEPCSQTPTNENPSRKASNSRDVGNSKDPSSNRNASFKQWTPLGEGSNSMQKCQQQ